ncbi:MAG: TrbC/VirB2 family protein [Treponema sp.]|jgi:hypothetical protein|nr:TrbC/VirB2 family protein [Treponema sp.]
MIHSQRNRFADKTRFVCKTRFADKAALFFLIFLTLSGSLAFGYKGDGSGENALTLLDSSGLPRILNTVLKFFSSGYMKAIVSIALGGLGIGMIMNRGEPGMIKKFIPWIAGCVLLLSLSTIVGMMGSWD